MGLNISIEKKPKKVELNDDGTPKKMEFSKKWLVGCIIVSIIFTSFSYGLALFDKNPVENLSISINQILWTNNAVSFMGYTIQNFMRAYSKNKYVKTEGRSYVE